MKLEKTLTDFPGYVRIRDHVQALKAEEQQITNRLGEIEVELSKPKRQIGGENAWQRSLEDKWCFEIDTAASLREEFSNCEGRLNFIREALSVGTMELDRVRGQASLEICQEVRPLFVKQAEKILTSLKAISEANEELGRLRDDLEQAGVATGSLPSATFDPGGRWNDQYGGRVTGFQRYVSEAYPEVEALAAQPVKAKLRALADRERLFEKEGAPIL
jgi:hypothetical protein